MTPAVDPLPLSLVAHTVFCPRRAWLEAMGEQVPSVAIEHGQAAHRRVDARSDDRTTARRSVDIEHRQLGLVGRCDVVEGSEDGVTIIEYKSSPIRRHPEVTPAQRVQLALQRLCLEDMGLTVVGAGVYFTTHQVLVDVELDEADRRHALDALELTRGIVNSTTAPLPLVDDPRCVRCSHASVCLPDEHRRGRSVRRVLASDPDGEVLHLTTPGSRAFLRQGRARVVKGEETIGSVLLEKVVGLVVHGNVDLSSALVRELLWRNIAIVWCSGRGTVIGHARSAKAPNSIARVRQHELADAGDLRLARELVASKIHNQATQLRRSSRDDRSREIARLRALARLCSDAHSVSEVLGFEGEAAATYFGAFPSMLATGQVVSSPPLGEGESGGVRVTRSTLLSTSSMASCSPR